MQNENSKGLENKAQAAGFADLYDLCFSAAWIYLCLKTHLSPNSSLLRGMKYLNHSATRSCKTSRNSP